jgi:hypothetical protein
MQLEPVLEPALRYILLARNPDSGWRYDVPPVGDSDTSMTAWMVAALVEARNGRVKLERLVKGAPRAFEDARAGALTLFDALTDPATGRTGYAEVGELSARTPANEHFDRELGETMTAAALASRLLLGQEPGREKGLSRLLEQQAELLIRRTPRWSADGQGNDLYYWYYGSQALSALRKHDAKRWTAWNRALTEALLGAQTRDGHAAGSWAPDCVWGYVGGRVYSTAMAVLALTVEAR